MLDNSLTPTIELLATEIKSLRNTVEQQSRTIQQQQARLTQLEADTRPLLPATAPLATDNRQSRRKLLKRMAVAAVGVATVGTALTINAPTASADTVSTVSGASTPNFGLTTAPGGIGVTPYQPTSGAYGVIGITAAPDVDSISAFPATAAFLGFNNNGNSAVGVYAKAVGTNSIGVSAVGNTGIKGAGNSGEGVIGTSVSNVGISGTSTSNYGVVGLSNNSYGGVFAGSPPLRLSPNLLNIPPTASTGDSGAFYVTASGVLYYKSGNNWLNLTNPNVNLLPNAVRVAATIAPFNATPLKATGANPTIGDTSTVQLTITGANGILAGAKGVIGVLTNLGATAGGNLRFWTGGIAPTISNLNIPGALPSLNLTASFAIPLDANGKTYLGFGTGAVGATCGYVVDISGYWL